MSGEEEEGETKVVLTVEQAVGILPDSQEIHSFSQAGPILIGSTMSKRNALDTIHSALQVEVAGPAARSMRHGLAVWVSEQDLLFVEHDDIKLRELEDQLNISTLTATD